MASDTTALDKSRESAASGTAASAPDVAPSLTFLGPLASLQLTVVLFALSIVLILMGTLAQDKLDMWEVMARYFRAWLSRVDVDVFFPRSWFPNLSPAAMLWIAGTGVLSIGLGIGGACVLQRRRGEMWVVLGGAFVLLGAASATQCVTRGTFYFPGGATLGSLLVLNLLAAHVVRFGIQAGGMRLVSGLLVAALGVGVTWFVIASGHNKEGLQGVPIFEWTTLWRLCKWAITAAALAAIGTWVVRFGKLSQGLAESLLVGACVLLLAGVTAWLWWAGDAAYLGDAGMRILWQLIQAGLAGLVLLAGCVLLFRRRGGLVLIHAGLGLLMMGEWFVSRFAVEERLSIREGETVNFAQDIRETELAIVDPQYSPTEDDVVVVSRAALLRSEQSKEAIADDQLPFALRVVAYWKNSSINDARGSTENRATAGHGLKFIAKEVAPRSGAGGDAVDMAAAYIELLEKGSGRPLGTYLFSQYFAAVDFVEKITLDGRTYDVSLRFKRSYKPYSMELIDVRKDDYVGTSTPRNYSSDVRLVDPTRNVDRRIRIWMNNPLRYAGETFYQSSYHRDSQSGVESTTLQVVTNTGWMIPYVACMLVATGMLAHFWSALMRFLRLSVAAAGDPDVVGAELASAANGKDDRRKRRDRTAAAPQPNRESWLPTILALAVVLLFALVVAAHMRPPRLPPDGFALAEFGKLPVAYQGRVKPLDTLARNMLRRISGGKETFPDAERKSQPAIRWLVDIIARPDAADKHAVFRIDNLEVLDTLGLKPRAGFRYSLAEIRDASDKPGQGLQEFDRRVDEAHQLPAAKLAYYQRKLLETSERFNAYMLLLRAFQPLDFSALADDDESAPDREAASNPIRRLLAAATKADEALQRTEAPLAVPVRVANDQQEGRPWVAYATACNKTSLRRLLPESVRRMMPEPTETPPALTSLMAVFAAYGRGDAPTFNAEVAKYRQWLTENRPQDWNGGRLGFEAYFNQAAPFSQCTVIYIAAFVATALAWLGAVFGPQRTWFRTCRTTAFWLIVLGAVVHTFGIVARVIISGRPPVTNLYSSAVFIAWACVLLGLLLEWMYRFGFGNLIAAAAGFLILLVASSLANRGDTFTVMQAVLDTQFWLATHVVCIALGYAVMFGAGLLGIIYILVGVFTPGLSEGLGRSLTRMNYGIVCFALFFSFAGTVLGGLWADDSWGRFWGWDPKENGALIIVLWCAIILHARWDQMVADRGMAVLAVGGNIVTAWSWFGVNELGVGLHSYGFTEGVLLTLALFALSQLAIIAIGLLPTELWLSYRSRPRPTGYAPSV
jgi:ABC-type transport system involved in cytochrome c biogenesis permease subunit